MQNNPVLPLKIRNLQWSVFNKVFLTIKMFFPEQYKHTVIIVLLLLFIIKFNKVVGMSRWKVIAMLFAFLLSGCTNIQDLQDLEVSLIKIEPTLPTGLSPRFNVQLLVSNPNAQDLEIEGVSLHLDIADQKILSGVSSQIPKLTAYSETPIEIQTSVNLLYLFKLLTYLSQHSGEDIKYQLNTKIDPKGFVAFSLNKEGLLNENLLQGLTNLSK